MYKNQKTFSTESTRELLKRYYELGYIVTEEELKEAAKKLTHIINNDPEHEQLREQARIFYSSEHYINKHDLHMHKKFNLLLLVTEIIESTGRKKDLEIWPHLVLNFEEIAGGVL